MCKTNMEMDLYYVNIYKHEHEKNMTRLWCKIVPKTSVEQIERNERSYSYLYPFRDLAQGNFQGGFLCVHQINKLFKNLPNWDLMWVNKNLTEN
jgi:hypothetical protein